MKDRQPIRVHRRILVGLLALILFVIEYVAFVADEMVRGYYFKDFSVRIPDAAGIGVLIFALYLLLVAATGRWLVVRAIGGRD